MSESIASWVSCHLFYAHDKLDFILKKGLEPFVASLKSKGYIKKFFFIRYRKFGPHIRLRLKLSVPNNRESVKQEVEVYFQKFFQEYPSFRPTPKNVANGEFFWYPNNSLKFIDYTHEIERYGGKKGVLIAEDHFEYSSEFILYLLKEEQKSYEQIISSSLLINLAFSFGIGLDKAQAIQFFKLLYNLWIPLSFRMEGGFEVDNDIKRDLSKKNIALFSKSFERDKDKLLFIINDWWTKFERHLETLLPGIQKWINDCSIINKKYKSTILSESIKLPKRFKLEISEHFSKEDIEKLDFNFWYIYQSLVHMNNNRVGLRNRDEPYVNYLIYRSLKN
jgi:hypothetical protein